MGHAEAILDFLASATGPICDDCLSDRTQITPRQKVNQRCRGLAQRSLIVRDSMSDCHYCHRSKLSNSLGKGVRLPLAVASEPANGDPHKLWHWEGNVQAGLVRWLVTEGWTILSAADTAAKTAGKDIIAQRGGQQLWVSVKGYPAGTTRTNPPTQARHWFAKAVFDLVMYRDQSDDALLALGLPDGFATYANLSNRVNWLRKQLPFSIYWVSQSQAIRVE